MLTSSPQNRFAHCRLPVPRFLTFVRTTAFVLMLQAGIGLTASPAETNTGYLPLRSEAKGHIADLALIYQGGEKRLAWSPDEFAPYVTWQDPDSGKEQWLFDGFLFIEFRDGLGHEYAAGYTRKPARQTEWRWLLERNFSRTNAIGALDKLVREATARIGAPPRPRKLVLTLPEPIHGQTNWGVLGGRPLDFNRAADRIAACEWHIDQALALWREARPRHLELAGFYWVAEQATRARDILPHVSKVVHDRSLHFYWIPYWKASGAPDWRTLGFDYAWQQPNHFFHPGKVPDKRLGEATEFAKQHGLGLEFEADARAISNHTEFRPRFHAYLNAFDRDGVASEASVAYYEGGGALLQMARSEDPAVRGLYHALARWVAGRQHGK